LGIKASLGIKVLFNEKVQLLKLVCLLVWGSMGVLTSGCGGTGSPFDYVKVSGKLSYEDGTPIPAEGIKLVFDSQAPPVGNAHPRPGSAMVSAGGAFQDVTSYKYADGLVPGKHKVSILYATDADGTLLVPADYTKASTTPLVVDTADSPFEIKVPKPKG
jgi:hypothetical protein